MSNINTKIWSSVLDLTQKQIGPERFNLWFKNVRMPFYDKNSIRIEVPNPFVKSWFETNFSSMIKENLQAVTSKVVDVQFSVGRSSVSGQINNKPLIRSQIANDEDKNEESCKTQATSSPRLLTLDDFVVGPCNRLAYASACELIKPENDAFNALFIHGQVGVGKTHLLHGIWNAIKKSNDGRKVAYLPAECWTNEFISSLRSGKLDAFRRKYRTLDILLIDDVHFIANKQGVQEELLHTFNILHGMTKRMIFASDSHPKFIHKLKDSLASRFMTGLVTKIDSPDFKTAYLILDSKLKKLKKEFPVAVLEYIAGTFLSNIRELECALTTVLAVANITKRMVDVEMAKDALADNIPRKSRLITIKDIETAVFKHFNITCQELHSSKRVNAISQPRQIAMYLASELTNMSRQQIGNHFGGKKHTTVIHAIKKIKGKIGNDQWIKHQVEVIKDEICGG
ncbi:MAG: chromosomal replication initiator protein DnaA [Candidatus Anammoxibacter sp.]